MSNSTGVEMNLSQEHIDLLDMNAIYEMKPDVKYRGKLYESNLYHCCNWTFTVRTDNEGNYFMVDTYWSSGDNLRIMVTDENFHEFKKIFNKDEVKEIRQDEEKYYLYDDVYRVALNSGGIRSKKRFVNKHTPRNKDIILGLMDEKIRYLQNEMEYLKQNKERLLNGEIDIDYISV